jgi:hypothetical protein
MTSYRQMNIGADAAEQDPINRLESYFLQTNEYAEVFAHRHHFVVGNRGTGKSAILRVMQHKKESGNPIYITPEKYSYSVLKAILDERPHAKWGQEASFASAWKYSILILLLKEIERSSKGTIARGPKKNIHDYLRANHDNVNFDNITLLYKFLERMQQVKAGDITIALDKATSLQRLYKLEELEQIRPDLLRVLDDNPFTVLIDELDTGWDNSEPAKYFIAGLFSAAQDLNNFHANLNVVVSLRQDIFEGVPSIYSDQEKIRDQIVRLKWNAENLFEMINSRISIAMKEQGVRQTDADPWHQLFDEDLTYKKHKSKNYVVERTLYRPRDIIQFLKAIFKSANKPVDQKLNYEDIINGEKDFSESKIKDLSAEYQFLYPGILKLFEHFRGCTYRLNRNELEEMLLAFSVSPMAKECGTWAAEVDPENLIHVLYEVGFIRSYLAGAQTGGRKHGSGYYGSYELSFKPNLAASPRFQISLVFRQYLQLKQPRGEEE